MRHSTVRSLLWFALSLALVGIIPVTLAAQTTPKKPSLWQQMKDAAKQAGQPQPQKPGQHPQPGQQQGPGAAQAGGQMNDSGPFQPPAGTKIEEKVLAPLQEGAKFEVSPHGVHVATVGTDGSRAVVYYDGVEGPKFDQIIAQGSYNSIVFSPDGNRYAYCARAGNQYVVMVDGKELVRSSESRNGSFDEQSCKLGFTSNGKHVYYLSAVYGNAGSFQRFVFDGKPEAPNDSGQDPREIAFSPDGDHYAYVWRDPSTTVSLLIAATPLFAQDSLQFNVPYACPDGSTYVVHKCEKGPKFEFCYYQRDQNSERYNVRAQVANQMNQCKIKGSPSAAPSASAQPSSDLQNSRWECGDGTTLTVFQCQKQNGQDYCFVKLELNGKFLVQVPKPRDEIAAKVKACKASASFNPPYLSEFPGVDRVIEGMKVSNTRDTVVRSLGAFYQLSEVIKVLSGQRASSGYLPDEKKLLDQYSTAQSRLEQAAGKALPGQQLSLATNPYHFSRSDPKFGFEGIPVWVAFLSPTLQAQFAQIVGGNNPAYNAKIQEERQRAIQGVQADAQAAQAQSQARQDPGSVAMRHCMESGRSDMECLGEGIKVGLVDLAGGNPLKGILPGVAPGLRLSGVYSAGNLGIGFDESSATIHCGDLIPMPLPYTVERTGSQVLVTVPISPKPLVLSYKIDGKLAGPGLIDVAGQVVAGGSVATTSTGYQEQTQTTMQTRQIDAAEAQNYAGTDAVHQNGMEYSVDEPVTSTSYNAVPVTHYSVPTKAKTEKCNAAVLPPTGSNVKISDALTQLLGTQASKAANTAPGLRLAGTYAGPGGLKIEFRDDSATVECGEARDAEAYSVQSAAGQYSVKVQNRATPFVLALQPNGALVGSGTVDVAGRRIVRSSSDDVHNFVPVNARCTLGTLTPQRSDQN